MNRRRMATLAGAAVALSGGLLAGLGVGSASASHARTATQSSSTALTQPSVTAVTTPTVPTQELPGSNKPVIVLGDLNTPEQFIIGQLYQLALEQQGYTVQISRNIGDPSIRTAALKSGTLDVYPEYLGEWNSRIAHLHSRFRTLKASYAAGSRYASSHGFVLLTPTPFSDTSCVAVTAQYAAQNDVHTIAQLARGTQIIFGAPIDFQTSVDGLPALIQSYHLHPGYVQSIGMGLQYWWLRSGDVQAAYCTTTDPELAGPQYVQLEDPRHVFGYGNVVPVTTPHVLKVEGPAFARTLERVDSLLTLQAMRGLNSEYLLGRHNPTTIAYQFLQGNGILPPSRYAPVQTTTSATPTATATRSGSGSSSGVG